MLGEIVETGVEAMNLDNARLASANQHLCRLQQVLVLVCGAVARSSLAQVVRVKYASHATWKRS